MKKEFDYSSFNWQLHDFSLTFSIYVHFCWFYLSNYIDAIFYIFFENTIFMSFIRFIYHVLMLWNNFLLIYYCKVAQNMNKFPLPSL